MNEPGKICITMVTKISDEDCVIVLGSDFVEVSYREAATAKTVKTREIVDHLCREITRAMEIFNER